MALGWVRSEGLAVDAAGVPVDLTIRSFGIIRPAEMPPVTVEIEDDDGVPVNGSDAVFAAVAAAAWRHGGTRPAGHYLARDEQATRALHTGRPRRRLRDRVRAGRDALRRDRRRRRAADRETIANLSDRLAEAGASLSDVVKTMCFLTDMNTFAEFNDAYSIAFGDHRPARSTVEVSALPGGMNVEIEAWAYRPQ